MLSRLRLATRSFTCQFRGSPWTNGARMPSSSSQFVRTMCTSNLESTETNNAAVVDASLMGPRRGPRPEDRPRGDTSRKYVKIDSSGRAFAKGSRKRAKAFVWVWEVQDDATAAITVNNKNLSEWLRGHWAHRLTVVQPFLETGTVGKYSVEARVHGGGMNGGLCCMLGTPHVCLFWIETE